MTACDCCCDPLPDGAGIPVHGTTARICHFCVQGDALCHWGDCHSPATKGDYCEYHWHRQRQEAQT